MIETTEARAVVEMLRTLSREIRDVVLEACQNQSLEALSQVAEEADEDTIFAIDKVSEQVLVSSLERRAAAFGGCVLVAEGIGQGELCLPRTLPPAEARWRVIIDPIDGTRSIMYQKRSAWVLAAVAPNHGPETSLRHVVGAVQTEIPTLKGAVSDELWVLRGDGVRAQRYELASGRAQALSLRPSRATSIQNGFAMLSRFFPGARDELASIDEAVVERVLGPPAPGKALCFEDQYASTGGQLYELCAGHDRFNADLRPLLTGLLAQRGMPLGLCCHPYDICTALIAEELGVILTGPDGGKLDVRLDVSTPVAWVAYANQAIRRQVEPALQHELKQRGFIE